MMRIGTSLVRRIKDMVSAVLIVILLVSIGIILWLKWKYRDVEQYLEQNYKTVKRRQLIEKRRR